MLLFAVGLEWSLGLSVVDVDWGWVSWVGSMVASRSKEMAGSISIVK